MAEEDTKSDINESKEASASASDVSESENEEKAKPKEKENGDENAAVDDSKENEDVDDSKENEDVDSKENENGDDSKENEDESKENEGGDESKENISDAEKTPEKTPKKTPKKTVPLYDQPLTTSGKRVRAKVEQFKVEQKEEHKYEFNGSGVALGEIPYIEEMINKELADDLKKLHSICFGRTGDRLSVKKHLKQFNGYSFDKNDPKYAAKKTNMERYKIADLKHVLRILGLERSGLRADLVERVIEFIVKPEDHGKSVPAKKKKKSKSGRKKKTGAGKSKGSRKSKGGDDENDSTANDTADSSDSGSDDDDGGDDDDDDDDDGGDDDNSDSEPEEKPKKTPAKKTGKTPAKKAASKTPARKTPAKKTPAKKTPAKKTPKRSKDEVDSDSDSSDDEPLIKKTKTAPSNDEIKQKVEKILDGADLEEVTMKSVCKQIYDMYPGFDLTDRKGFIKDTVKSVLG